MKNLYSSLFAGAAVLVATSLNAQSFGTGKGAAAQRPLYMVVPGAAGHHVAPYAARGTAPLNDECTGAVNQNLAVGGSITFTGDNTGSTDGEGLGFPNVWETFTLNGCADVTLNYCGTSPAFGNALLTLFVGCPLTTGYPAAGFDTESCGDGNVSIFYPTLPPGQYYYAVILDDANGAVGPYTVNVTAAAPAIGCNSANDECGGAITLTPSTSCIGTLFSTAGATESLDPIECAGFTSSNAHDVWFQFTATATTMTIAVTGFNEADALIELFEGTCGNLTSLQCADETFPQSAGEQTSEQLIYTNCTVGTTYFVRVYDWGYSSPEHNFEICVVAGEGTNIGIEENANASDWSVFPNPGTGVFTLQYSGANAAADIEVFDLTGRAVYTSRTAVANGTNHTLDLTGVSAGNYNVRLTVNGVRTEQRLMVK
ncbi:MAG: T9SS type A sorting domain-containing protein [Flavobacteriales bacterium]